MYKFEVLSYPADPSPPAVPPPPSCPALPSTDIWTSDGASKVRRLTASAAMVLRAVSLVHAWCLRPNARQPRFAAAGRACLRAPACIRPLNSQVKTDGVEGGYICRAQTSDCERVFPGTVANPGFFGLQSAIWLFPVACPDSDCVAPATNRTVSSAWSAASL